MNNPTDVIEVEQVTIKRDKAGRKASPRRTFKMSEEQRAKVLDLSVRGDLSNYDIGRAAGVSEATVRKIKQKYSNVFTALPRVDSYRSIKADLLSAAQLAALESAMSGNKLAKAGFLSTLQGFDILNKAERLETGKSTENHAHSHFGRISVINKTSDSNDLP